MIEGRTTFRKILEEGHFETSPFDDARIVMLYSGPTYPYLVFMDRGKAAELAEALRKRVTFAGDGVELAWRGVAGPALLGVRTAGGRRILIELAPPEEPGELAELVDKALDE